MKKLRNSPQLFCYFYCKLMVMKTYIDYIKNARIHQKQWYYFQKTEWWKKKPYNGEMDIKGDYLETMNFKSNDRKNDVPLFTNHTNVNNSNWGVLFFALGQHLIDWCISHKKNVYSCLVKIDRIIDGTDDVYKVNTSLTIRDDDGFGWKRFDDPEFEIYGAETCDMLDRFVTVHKDNLPLDWNYFAFSLDCLEDSCECGEWCCASDGYLCFGNINNDEYDKYVYCM